MTTQDLIKYLRLNVSVVDPDSGESDKLYLKLTDDDLRLYLDMARTRAFYDESLDDFPEEFIYPLMLLAKKELYMALAIKHANYVEIGADDNNYLKKSQWFDHYMKLVENVDDDYQSYLDQGGAGSDTLSSANVYLANRYYTEYNYEKANLPYIKLKLDRVTENTIEVSWRHQCDRYLSVGVYISKHPIADTYKLSGSQISEISKQVATVKDPHVTKCRISGCETGVDYYVLATITDWTGRSVYNELKVTTISNEPTEDIVEATL